MVITDMQNKYVELVEALMEVGVLDIKNGSATLHFDSEGNLASIEANLRLFRREPRIKGLSTLTVIKNR